MKDFRRVFKYVWPQWPRIIVVLVSAMIVSSLLSLSFMTIIPLLKVMMGQEGLHGWIERKICAYRYGIILDTGFSTPNSRAASSIQYPVSSWLVTNVEQDSPAAKAGLQKLDIITRCWPPIKSGGIEYPVSSREKLLEALATAPENTDLIIQVRRLGNEGAIDKLTFNTGPKPFYIDHIEKLMGLLPRPQTEENKTKTVIFIILAMGVVTIIRCLAKFYQEYMAQKVVQIGINHLREDAFGHAMDVPVGFFANERPSDTVSRIIGDTSVMGKAVKIMLGKALREPLNALFMVTAAMLLNWQLTLIFLCGAPVVLGLVFVFGKKMKRATRKSLMASSQMLAKLQETMAGLKVVKVYNRHEYERDSFRVINNRLLKQLLKISKVDAATTPIMEVLGMAAGSAALIVGAYWVTAGAMDGPEFFGLLILLGAAAESVRKTSDIWNKIQEANAAAERVFAVIDAPVECEKPGARRLPPLKDEVEFKDVVFTYPGADEPALKGINLVVPAGHNVAIVGPNGSGKTTLANLIPRFYDPDNGQVLIDGIDIRVATLSSLRGQIGMVTQNVITFNATVAENIAYGKPGATTEEIIAAAKRAFAHEFIEPLLNGYDTMIGEQGVGLSGGQLQRIIIARAILKNPPILIFDEATSQVDADSEAKIHKAIEEIMQDRTTFIIAHRFSTVITADVIVVMDNGQIIAQGQHDELMQTCPLYQSLYETQLVKA
ncbi:MAG: ABC transporter transmembrane domain-containing protein [Sedimentisphaerales bacterium]